MLTLSTPISQISKIGKIVAKQLKKLKIETASDLLTYYPFRYDDFSHIIKIKDIQPETAVTLKVKIELIANKRSKYQKKLLTECLAGDETGSIKVVWFNQPFLTKILKPGDWVYLAGRAEYDYQGMQLISPSYEKIFFKDQETTHTGRLVPIYSITQNLSQKQIRFLIKLVLPLAKKIEDWLPLAIKKNLLLKDLSFALKEIHFPLTQETLNKAQKRLKFDELFLNQLRALSLKTALKSLPAPQIEFKEKETKELVSSLPFKLTLAQRKSAWEILKDLKRNQPMNRLLCGEVGSGKTIVAAIAILNAILNNFKVVYLAPTEILAYQHFNTMSQLFKKWNFKILLYTRSQKIVNNGRAWLKSQILKTPFDFIVGTHALLEEKIQFFSLGLVIVDEQHRFGVEQRKNIKEKGGVNLTPHFLSMTATPIPRSLTLTLYGDLDLSVIDELPKERKKVHTYLVPSEKRQAAYQFIKKEIKTGRQVFVICPLIDPSDKLGVKSVKVEYEKLDKEIFPELKIGLLHGQLKAQEKEKIMQEFLDNQIKILVATSLIEVGIDIGNASIMMIEGAERFGLSQLHQFRGRVGRSQYQSYCFLFTEHTSPSILDRLMTVVTTHNGFVLAEKDLRLRGPGEVFGLRQSGLPTFKIASFKDYELIKEAKKQAEKLLIQDSTLKNEPWLKNKLAEFEKEVHLE